MSTYVNWHQLFLYQIFQEVKISSIGSPKTFTDFELYFKKFNRFNCNEIDQIQTPSQGQKYPKFIRRLKLSNVINCAAGYGEWKVLAHVIVQALVGNPSECKTYAMFDCIDNRTYHGDLVIKMKNEFRKKTFLEDILSKKPKPRGNFFSLRKIYLNEGLVIAANHDGFIIVDEEPEETPKNRYHFITFLPLLINIKDLSFGTNVS